MKPLRQSVIPASAPAPRPRVVLRVGQGIVELEWYDVTDAGQLDGYAEGVVLLTDDPMGIQIDIEPYQVAGY